MADSDITVDGLTATGGVGQVVLNWNTPVDPHTPGGLPNLQKEAIEIWAGTTNNRDAVTTVKIGEQPSANSFTHAGLTRGASRRYWIKARDRFGLHGEWFPVSGTGGILGVESNSNVSLTPNGYFKNTNGLIEQWGQVIADSRGTVEVGWNTEISQILSFSAVSGQYVAAGGGGRIIPVSISLSFLDVDLGFGLIALSLNPEGGDTGSEVVVEDAVGCLIYWRALGVLE